MIAAVKKLRIAVVDILGKSHSGRLFTRMSRANNTSIMPQAVAAWCEELGHDVSMVYYSGPVRLSGALPDYPDLVFIGAFSQTAQVAYALSAVARARGAVTVLGGPHARSYPQHARRFFDWVVGTTDKALIADLVANGGPSRPLGQCVSAAQPPSELPGMEQRWKFLLPIATQSPVFRMIPVLGSFGCPYTCEFCIDGFTPHQPRDAEALKADLGFLVEHLPPRSLVAWHDANFGVRFDESLDAIEAVVPPGRFNFVAESTMSVLTEPNLRRLRRNGFKVMATGIESWHAVGDKSRTRSVSGIEKVRQLADHANLVLEHLPYFQTNFIHGLDADDGGEPFELTKRFIDAVPGAFPYFSLLTAFGRDTPMNLEYVRAGRVVPTPFHFLNQLHATNVRPLHYDWTELLDRVCDLDEYAFSHRAIAARFRAGRDVWGRLEQVVRGFASERSHRCRAHRSIRRQLHDPAMRRFVDGDTVDLPAAYREPVRGDLGPLWLALPPDALTHEPAETLREGGEVGTVAQASAP